ncbi:MAG: DUF4417 domain-containing protein [Fibrobacter intestinalis]|uniref:DUF4417 domain-containing protein n=1 Tax=Fibrobacter intestinalis TaxID=28122 RepID=UPI003F100E7F
MRAIKIPYIVQWGKTISFDRGIPWIKRQKINLHGKKFVLINEVSKIPEERWKEYILLFYAEERHFNAFYTELDEKRLSKLQKFYAICGLDYSTYPDLDDDENRVAIKRNRRFCVYCQQKDILCIYNIVWTGKSDYNLAFSNVEDKATVAVSTYRISSDDDKIFREGYEQVKQKIKPSLILCYGNPQKCMEKDVRTGLVNCIPSRFELAQQERSKQLSIFSEIQPL